MTIIGRGFAELDFPHSFFEIRELRFDNGRFLDKELS